MISENEAITLRADLAVAQKGLRAAGVILASALFALGDVLERRQEEAKAERAEARAAAPPKPAPKRRKGKRASR